MDLLKILSKIAKGEALTDEEKKFAGEYRPDDTGRIPKERLDQEIAKRKAAEDQLTDLNGKYAELQAKWDEQQNAGLSEAEKAKAESARQLKSLQDKLAAETKAREEAVRKAADLEFSVGVKEIAGKHNFTDAEYLGYRLQSAGIKLDDANGVASFMKELEKTAPGLFRSSAKPGAGTGGADQSGNAGQAASANLRLQELGKKTELSSREVAEFIALQEQAANGQQTTTTSNGGQQQ